MKNDQNKPSVAEITENDKQTNGPPRTINQQPDAEQARTEELNTELENLKSDLEKTKGDLETARTNSQPTAPIYVEKQNLEERIRSKELEIERHCRPHGRPRIPDMKTNQIIIGTGSVRRKSDASLVERRRKPDQIN